MVRLVREVDAAAFEQVYQDFQEFHAYFAGLFGRWETRERSGHYLQALLVQSEERRNAENLSETVPGSARGMQRFLTDSPWDDDAVIGRLQEYLGPKLEHPGAVWVLDGSDFPKQGRKSAGVARQYPRSAGQGVQLPGGSNCQGGPTARGVQLPGRNVPGRREPVGTGPGGQASLSPGELDLGPGTLCRGGSAGGATEPPVEDGTGYGDAGAGEMLERAVELGHLKAGWVAADDAFGMLPSLRDGLATLGMHHVLDVPACFTVWPVEPEWTTPVYRGRGGPPKPRLVAGQRRTKGEQSAATNCRRMPGRRSRWPREARGRAVACSAPRG